MIPVLKPTVQSYEKKWIRKGGGALFNHDVHPSATAEWLFSNCVRTGCSTVQAPCH